MPDTSTSPTALLELARRRSPHVPHTAGDVVLLLSERLMPGGILRRALATHPNPAAPPPPPTNLTPVAPYRRRTDDPSDRT